MRAVSVSRGRCTPGRSTRTICQSPPGSVAIPRTARLVVWGRSETIATFEPTIAFASVDLPTLGRPASPTKPARVTARASSMTAVLERQHLAVVASRGRTRRGAARRGLSPRPGRPSARGRSRRRPARAGRRPAGPVDREREHVRRLVEPAVLAVELADPLSPTSSTDRWPASTPARSRVAATAARSSSGTSDEARVAPSGALEVARAVLLARTRRRRRRCAERACGARRPRCRSGRRRCRRPRRGSRR